jgi:hypothetical protein
VIGGVVRIEALRAFCALVELEIPELAGRTCAGQAPSSEIEELPNLSIEPGEWMFDREQARIVARLPGNVAVYEVGNHEAPCAISIVAGTLGQRAAIEAKVIDLFLRSTHPLTGMSMPGVVVLQVTACPELSRWSCSFDLESDRWDESAALDRRYESRIAVTATIPALTVRRPVYSIDRLLLGVAEMSTPSRPAPPPTELVSINADGTLQEVPVP